MDMSKEANEVVLCVSNAYQKKFYLNENFNGLPQSIRDELKIMCVIYTEDIGGVLELEIWNFALPAKKAISAMMRSEAC